MRTRFRRVLSVLGGAAVLAAPLVTLTAASPAGATGATGWTITTFAGSGPPSVPGGVGNYSGDGGPATSATLAGPLGATADAAGNVYIADSFSQRISKVDLAGIITTVAGTGDADYNGDGIPATSAFLNYPTHVAFDGAGNMYIADGGNNRVRKVNAAGIITTVAGDGNPGFGGDGGPATAAQLNDPQDVAADPAGNLYIADWGNQRVRKVSTTGIITTFAGSDEGYGGDGGPATSAKFENITGVALDRSGNLFVADPFNGRVRKVDTHGIVTTVAGNGTAGYSGDGGPATAAQMDRPTAVVVQGSGNLFISDYGNSVVRRVDAAGIIDSVAGTGHFGFGGDGGFGPNALLSSIAYLGLDSRGNLYISDETNKRIRRLETSYLWIRPAPRLTAVGNSVTYAMTVSGLPTTTTGVTVQATLDPRVTFTSATAPGGACSRSGAVVTCPLGTVTPGTVASAQITVQTVGTGIVPINGAITSASPAIPSNPTAINYSKVAGADCGRVVTASTQLTADVGPCAARGIIAGADGITIDLNGHRVFGFAGPGNGGEIGIAVPFRRNVTVKNGTVSDFDAGVLLLNGGGHQLSGLTVKDNIGPDDIQVDFGDGIAIFDSDSNRVSNNTIAHNGIFDGIAVIGPGAHDNLFLGNVIKDTVGPKSPPGAAGQGIAMNGFSESPNSDTVRNTTILGNTITGNASAGLSMVSVVGGQVANNTVTGNGLTNSSGNGIGLRQFFGFGAPTTPSNVYIVGNQVHGNGWDGIRVESTGNQIVNNNAADNNVLYHDPSLGDLHDESRDPSTGAGNCFGNTWNGNIWGSGGYLPPCTTNGGQAAPSASVAPAQAAQARQSAVAAEGPAKPASLPPTRHRPRQP